LDNKLSAEAKSSILIFTSKTGGGHISLAEALRDRLQDRCRIEIIDPQPDIIHLHYRLVTRHALWLWAAEFRATNHPGPARVAHRLYTALISGRVEAALRAAKPDLVISTYSFLTSEVTHAIQRSGRSIPFVILFADPNGVHQTWLAEHQAAAFFAPTRETYDQALAAGFDRQRLHLTGWPVRTQFYRASPYARADLLAELGLDPKCFTLFLQGGGEGSARFVSTIEAVLAVPTVQVILATGTNQSLHKRFSGLERLYALPFTKDIARYMAAADVVMGKAGPNTLFEAVTLGKPFIATAYIPGKEQANLEFIKRHGLGWVALERQAQMELVQLLASSPARLGKMQQSVKAYRDWNSGAVESIVPLLEQMCK
jgi:UDP-N-acetylglucosamine:LPS N-acetylglucosamine transferase